MAQSDSEGSADEPLQAGAGASGAAAAARRQLRPRSAQHRPLVDEHPELDALLGREEEGAEPSNQRQLDVPLRCAMVERDAPAASFAAATPADEVTATALAAAGLRRPLHIRAEAEGGAAAARSALGLRLPPAEHLTPAGLAEQLGAEHEVPTIDVPTQGSGPRVTLAQLADYLGQRQAAGQPQAAKRRRHQAQGALAGRLLNVVSLSLAGTALEGAISPPAAVEELELVGAVWPDEDAEEQRPETLLYALLGPAGVYTDWHVDMGGSAVWYHVVSGRKVFLAAPPTPENLQAFEEWSSSGKQASSWLGDKLSGLMRLSVGAGDTLLLPSAWPHAVSTPEPTFAVGGNFLHALDFGAIAECYRREQRLGVTPKFQFPLFRRLMWYAAEHALHRLRPCVRQGLHPGAAGVTRWELGGLPALADLLGEWWRQQAQGGSRKAAGVPARISEPWELLEELQDCLESLHRRQRGQHPPQECPSGRQQAQGKGEEQQQQQHLLQADGQQDVEEAGEAQAGGWQQHQLEQGQQPLAQQYQLAGGTGEADPTDAAADDLAMWAALAVVGGVDMSAADADAAGTGGAAAPGSRWGSPGVAGGPAGLGSPAPALQHRQQPEEVLPMVPLEEAGGGGGGSGDMGLPHFFEEPPRQAQAQQEDGDQLHRQGAQQGRPLGTPKRRRPEGQPRQGRQAGVRGAASAASDGRQAGNRDGSGMSQQQRAASSGSSSEGEPSSPSGSDVSESESLEDEQLSSGEEAEERTAGKALRTGGSKRRQRQQQQPALRRLRRAGGDGGATTAAAPAAKRQRSGARAARGTAGSAAEGPTGSPAGMGAVQGRTAGRQAREAAAAAPAAGPPVPPPPADLQALGRKHTLGYTISLSRRRSSLQRPSTGDARQPEQAVAQNAPPSSPAAAARSQGQEPPLRQDSASIAASGRTARRSAGAPAAAEEEAPPQQPVGRSSEQAGRARPAQLVGPAPRQSHMDDQEAAEKLLGELQKLQAVVRREEELLARVQAGLVSLPDGGTKLSASLAQRREALKRKTDAAEGRVLTYLDADTGAEQGPFSASQLQKLLRAGVVEEATVVRHPQEGEMPLAEALRLPEPLSAQLLRQREQAAQQEQAAQAHRGAVRGVRPHDFQRGTWRPRGRRGWEEERRRREWEEEQRRMDAEAHAMAAAAADQEETGMWCFRDERGGRREMEGPYTVAELRGLHMSGAITDDVLVHDEEQGVSVHLFTLLGYTDLAEVARRQRAEAAAREREREALEALRGAEAAASDAARAAAGQGQAAGPAAAAAGGQPDGWDGGFDAGSGGAGPSPSQPSPVGGANGAPYEPSPAYSPPAAPQHVLPSAELYSPSRADWDDEEEAAAEEKQPAVRPSKGPAGSEPAAAADEAPPPPPPPPPSAAHLIDMEIDDAPAAVHDSTAREPQGQTLPTGRPPAAPVTAEAAPTAAQLDPLALTVPTPAALPGQLSGPAPAPPAAPGLLGFAGPGPPASAAATDWGSHSASLATGGTPAPGLAGPAVAAAGGMWAPPQQPLALQQAAAAPVAALGATAVRPLEQQPLQQRLLQPVAQLCAAPPWAGSQGGHLSAPVAQQAQQPISIESQLLLAQQLQLLLAQQSQQAQQAQHLTGAAQPQRQQWPQLQQPAASQQPLQQQQQHPPGQSPLQQVQYQLHPRLQAGYGQQQPMQQPVQQASQQPMQRPPHQPMQLPPPSQQQLLPPGAGAASVAEQQQRQAYLQRLQQQQQSGAASAAELEGALFFGDAQHAQHAQRLQQGQQQQEPFGDSGSQWQGSRQRWQGDSHRQSAASGQRWERQPPQRWQQGRGGGRGGRWRQGSGQQQRG